jgi:hypothetical protein
MVSFIKTYIWVGTYAMLFLLPLCVSLSETVASGSQLPHYFLSKVFCLFVGIQDLDLWLKI